MDTKLQSENLKRTDHLRVLQNLSLPNKINRLSICINEIAVFLIPLHDHM